MGLISVQEVRANWRILLGSIIGPASGIALFNQLSSYFIKPFGQAFGWSRAEASISALAFLLVAISLPFVGMLVDRLGSRPLVAIGTALFALTYAALGFMTGQLWYLVLVVLFIGLLAGPTTSLVVYTRPLVENFSQSRGLALALCYSGYSFIALLIQPVLQGVMHAYGWRAGFALLGPVSACCGLAALWLLRGQHRPRRREAAHGAPPVREGRDFREALRDPRLWLLLLSTACAGLSIGAFAGQLQALLSDMRLPGSDAAALGSWFAASTIIGRLICGLLLDKAWPPGVASLALGLPVAGFLLFLAPHPPIWLLASAMLFIGFSLGAEGDLVAFLTSRYFGLKAFGAIFGLFGFAIACFGALGTVGAGLLFDKLGSYHLVLQMGAGLAVIASVSVLASGVLGAKATSATDGAS